MYVMIQELDTTSEETFATNLPQLCAHGRDLMRKMLKTEPDHRISAADALCHPYFEGIHEQCPVVGQYLPRSMPAAPIISSSSLKLPSVTFSILPSVSITSERNGSSDGMNS